MTINDNGILHSARVRMKEMIASGIDDPLSRGGAGSSFVYMSWPHRKVSYPYFTVDCRFGAGQKMGMDSEMHMVPILYDIDVWAKKEKHSDGLTGSLFNLLRTFQYGNTGSLGTSTVNERLYDFNWLSSVPLNEPGKDGVRRKNNKISYKYYTSG